MYMTPIQLKKDTRDHCGPLWIQVLTVVWQSEHHSRYTTRRVADNYLVFAQSSWLGRLRYSANGIINVIGSQEWAVFLQSSILFHAKYLARRRKRVHEKRWSTQFTRFWNSQLFCCTRNFHPTICMIAQLAHIIRVIAQRLSGQKPWLQVLVGLFPPPLRYLPYVFSFYGAQ